MLLIVLAGSSYKSCPIELREKLAPSRITLLDWLDILRPLAGEAVILSTCHRLELYAIPRSALIQPPQLLTAVAPPELLSGCYHAEGEDAVRHLFRVSAGLDSAVTGETEILRQVRQADELSRSQGTSGPVLSALFRQAAVTGKRARPGGLRGGYGYASLGGAAVSLAAKLMGPLQGKSALILGAGKVGEVAAQALKQHGVARIIVTSRTFPRAQELAHSLGTEAIAFGDVPRALASCHLVLSATTAPHWIVSREMVAQAMAGRAEPLLILDLAVPRDIEPTAATLPGVTLYNVDDLAQQLGLQLPGIVRGLEQAEAAVEAGVASFNLWLLERQATPAITALYRRADEVSRGELKRAQRRLGDVSTQEWETLHHLTRAISRKLLHPAVTRLRAEAASGNSHRGDELVTNLLDTEGNDDGKTHRQP